MPDAAPIDQTPASVQWENDQSPLQEAAEGTPRLKSPTSATKSAETRHGDYLLLANKDEATKTEEATVTRGPPGWC